MDGLPGGGSFSLGRRSAAASTINTGLDRGGDHRQTTASLARIIGGGGGGDQDCETVGRTRESSNASSWRGPRERSRVGEADAEPAAAGDGEHDVKLSLCVSVCLLDDDFRRRPGATFAMAFGSVDPPYRLSAPSALHRDTTARSLPVSAVLTLVSLSALHPATAAHRLIWMLDADRVVHLPIMHLLTPRHPVAGWTRHLHRLWRTADACIRPDLRHAACGVEGEAREGAAPQPVHACSPTLPVNISRPAVVKHPSLSQPGESIFSSQSLQPPPAAALSPPHKGTSPAFLRRTCRSSAEKRRICGKKGKEKEKESSIDRLFHSCVWGPIARFPSSFPHPSSSRAA